MNVLLQKHTSANTSVNSTKLPTAFNKYVPYGHVLDYGCGKFYERTKQHCDKTCLSYNPYDPYNCDAVENDKSITFGKKHGYDTIFCCNVLNVIDSDSAIWSIIHNMFNMVNSGGKIYIQIYEGNKSGVSRETKKDCFQRNEPTANYFQFMGACQGRPFKTELHGNIIIIIKL